MIDLLFRVLGIGFLLALLLEIPLQVWRQRRRVDAAMVRKEFFDAASLMADRRSVLDEQADSLVTRGAVLPDVLRPDRKGR